MERFAVVQLILVDDNKFVADGVDATAAVEAARQFDTSRLATDNAIVLSISVLSGASNRRRDFDSGVDIWHA